MPYSSLSDINPALKGIDPPITLAQANHIASVADGIGDEDDETNPWAVAIAQFKKTYVVEGDGWVKKHTENEPLPELNMQELQARNGTYLRDQCMQCESAPTIEALWAEGMGRAWFCAKHYKEWSTKGDGKGEVSATKEIEHGIARRQWRDRASPKTMKEIANPGVASNIEETRTAEIGRRVRHSRLDQTHDLINQARSVIDGLTDFVRWAGYVDEDLSKSEVTRGLYIIEPHGEMISKGKKTSIAKSRIFDGMEGDWILVSGNKAYGIVTMNGDADEVNVEQFDKAFSSHRVTKKEREKWWKSADKLYLYHVKRMLPFEKPKIVKLPQGVQTVIEQVDYAEASSVDLEFAESLKKENAEALTDEEKRDALEQSVLNSTIEQSDSSGHIDPQTLLELSGATAAGDLPTGVKTFQGEDGKTWLLLWTANAFRDKDGEIFATKAIDEYVERHNEDDVKGEFQFWHLPGTKFGDIKWQGVAGRFLVEMGTFDDTEIGRLFQSFFEKFPQSHPNIAPRGWGASHTYEYKSDDRSDGVYQWFEKTESSVLPSHEAANPHNPKMEVFPMNEKQKDALAAIGEEIGVGGDKLVAMVDQMGEKKTKELEGDGVGFKAKKASDFIVGLRDVASKMEDDDEQKDILTTLISEVEKALEESEDETDEDTKDLSSLAKKVQALAAKIGGPDGGVLSGIAKELEGYAAADSGKGKGKAKEDGTEESDTEDDKDDEDAVTEFAVAEAESGEVIGLVPEDSKAATDPRAPLRLFVQIIKPGWGNARDNNYYPAELLKRDSHIFEGAKMYATDHKPSEKNVRSEVGLMEKAPVFFTDDGAPVGIAVIHEPNFAEATRNRHAAGHLRTLKCSIYAKGEVKEGFEKDGRKGNLVEAIVAEPKPDVDWVSREGAGGAALDLAEDEKFLSEAEVNGFLSTVKLPEPAVEWLREGQYQDTDKLKSAVEKARDRIKTLTKSGKVFGQGAGENEEEKEEVSMEEYDASYSAIAEKYNLTLPVTLEKEDSNE